MKKFLALLLALVMTMSLVTVGASAKTFSDSKDVSADCAEAVEVLSEMGVIDGYKDGSFKPKAELNRAAGAKFIAYLMLGEKKADGLVATGTLFEDVSADYALAPYVEWCAKMGIVDGYGNGKFGPKNALTQAAFGKMLLTALGYDSAKEGYTGAGWQKTVYADGVAAGVYGDDGEVFAACNRETAAKMALGALLADMVCYGKTVKVIGVEGFVEKVLDGKFNNLVLPVALAENGAVATGEKLFEKYDKLKYYEGCDIYGRPGHKWEYKSFEQFYMDAPVAEYTEEVDVCDLLVELGIAKTNLKDSLDVVAVTVDGRAANADAIKYTHKNCTNKSFGAQGALTQVFEVDDDEYVVTIINTYLAEVTAVKEAKHGKDRVNEATLKVYTNANGDVAKIEADTLEKGDMVLVNLGMDIVKDHKYVCGVTIWTGDAFDEETAFAFNYVDVLGAADSKEGKLTGASKTETRIDKVAYDDAAKFILNKDWAKAAPNSGEKFVFFFDQYGNVIGCKDVDVTNKYTVIDKAWKENIKGTDTAFANLVGFDGKPLADEVKVADNEVDNVDVNEYKNQNEDLYDDIFVYDVNSDDEYEFDCIEAAVAGTTYNMWSATKTELDYDEDTATITVNVKNGTFDWTTWTWTFGNPATSTPIKMNKNTVVLAKDLYGNYDVFTGNDLPGLVSFGTVAYVNDDDDVYAELVYITDALYVGDSVTGYVFASNGYDWDGDFENVTVWVGAEKVVVKVDSDDGARYIPESGFYKFTAKIDKDENVVTVERITLDGGDGYRVGGKVTGAEKDGDLITCELVTVKATDKVALYLIDADEETITAITYADVVTLFDGLEKVADGYEADENLECEYHVKNGNVTEMYFEVV